MGVQLNMKKELIPQKFMIEKKSDDKLFCS